MTINVGERIRQVRLMRGMTQEALAEKVFIKKSTISAYENNAITLPVDRLEAIAAALNTAPAFFLISNRVPENIKADEAMAFMSDIYFFIQKSIQDGMLPVIGERQ